MQVHRLGFTGLTLDCRLPAAPGAVWPLVSDPELMARWSTARVRGVEPGDGGSFATVGTLREVVLPSPLPPVTEVIQHADVPSRLVYRAVDSWAIRHHHGQIRLSGEEGGTRLTWDLRMAFAVPGAAAAIRRRLEPEMTASLRRLATVVAGADPVPAPAQPPFRDDEDSEALASAQDTARVLGRLADEMEAAGDPRHWFSRVYQYVTEAMVEASLRGAVAHPTWALRLIPRFHELYAASLEGAPEPHWQAAFAAIDSAAGEQSSGALPFWRALVAGARAHIEGDLPRVLGATYDAHYAERCDYARFRADFLLLGPALSTAWQRLSEQVPARWFPPYLRILGQVLPQEAVERLTAKRFYDPVAARRAAFEQGYAWTRLAARQRRSTVT